MIKTCIKISYLRFIAILSLFLVPQLAAANNEQCVGSPLNSSQRITIHQLNSVPAIKTWDKCIGTVKFRVKCPVLYCAPEIRYATYSGYWKNGLLNGEGTAIRTQREVGQFVNGNKHGVFIASSLTVKPHVGASGVIMPGQKYRITYENGKFIESKPISGTSIKLKSKNNISKLQSSFQRLELNEKKVIQQNLKRLGYYTYGVDGLYGKATERALIKYNKQFLRSGDLEIQANVITLLNSAMQHSISEEAPNTSTSQPADKRQKVQTEKTVTLEDSPGAEEKIDHIKFSEIKERYQISLYGSFMHTERVPDALFFFDKIENADSFEFRKAIRNHQIETIVLSSPGGSVFEGLQMAGIINDKNLDTYIPENGFRGPSGTCASACSYMFFAGASRQSHGRLGVHQVYSANSAGKETVAKTEKRAQFTVSEIIGFLNEFETPAWVFEKMFQQSKMYFFDQKELSALERFTGSEQRELMAPIENFIEAFRAEFN